MQVKLGGAFAGYFLLVLVISFWPKPKPRELAYEVWTLKGYIEDEDGKTLQLANLNLSTQPSGFDYSEDGVFSMDILVKRGQSGQLTFPRLLVARPGQGIGNATVRLDPSEQLFGTKKYNIERKDNTREMMIKETIKLGKIPPAPAYAPQTATLPQPTATVLPESTTHDSPQ
jgi:hypothetical protein